MFIGELTAVDACDKLVDLHAWPTNRIDVGGWLNNFRTSDERALAAHMLSQFMFFSDEVVNALFSAAFQSLSNFIRDGWNNRSETDRRWNEFLNSAYITMVQGEVPNPTDSGFLFTRKARQLLRVPEDQILSTNAALAAVANGFGGPIIFVDDFVGSGEQFINTWDRRIAIDGQGRLSFRELAAVRPRQFYYCNAMMTGIGRQRILNECPNVVLATGNVILNDYNWTSETSVLWPDTQRTRGIEFIRDSSRRFGLGDDDGGERDWRGFHKLGLGVAFEHTTPDATLPLFHWSDGWCPLVRRA